MFDDFDYLFELNNNFKSKSKLTIFKKPKKVSFSQKKYVYILPYCNEKYNNHELWWSPDELLDMRKKSFIDIQNLMNHNPLMEINDAKKLLFQPNNISYDIRNFDYY